MGRTIQAGLIALLLLIVFPSVAAAQDLTFSFEFGESHLNPGASSVVVDADGNPWVADSQNNRIIKYDFNGVAIVALASPIGGGPAFNNVRELTADAFGSVYAVLDGTDNQVVKFDSGGTFEAVYGPPATPGAPAPSSPSDVAVDSAGNVYISDPGGVFVYSPAGAHLGTLPLPSGRLAIHNDDIYVASGAEVKRYRRDGTLVSTFGADTFTAAVRGIDLDPLGRLYAAGGGGDKLRRFSADGASVEQIGESGINPGQYNLPVDVASDCRGNIYLLEVGRPNSQGAKPFSTVLRYNASGALPLPCEPATPPSGTVDTQINDVEATQGIQPTRTFVAALTAKSQPEPRGRVYGQDPDQFGTTEVPLREHGKTLVRVYANLVTGPPGGIGNVPATLEGITADGKSLGTIQPTARPPVLEVGDLYVYPDERELTYTAFTFVLPEAWTKAGAIDLIARVNPAGIGCDQTCRNRSTFRLSGIPFLKVAHPKVVPLALTDNGVLPVASGHDAFGVAEVLTPLDLDIYEFHGSIGVDDLVNSTSVTVTNCFLVEPFCTEDRYVKDGGESQKLWREWIQSQIYDRIEAFTEERGLDNCDNVLIGLIRENDGLPGSMRGDWQDDDSCARGYAAVHRPITAVAHELQHALGRPHASSGCVEDAEQNGEAWPPDEMGFLSGTGIDTRAGSGGARQSFDFVGPEANGRPLQLYDLMGYCGNEKSSWISPRGWNSLIGFRAPSQAAAASSTVAQASQAGVPMLRVTALDLGEAGVGISASHPTSTPDAGPADSIYRLEARAADGSLLASVPASAIVPDDGSATLIEGTVPLPEGTTQVLAWRGMETAGLVLASANAPAVRLNSPKGGARVATKTMKIRWNASDADGPEAGPLTAVVEYSARGNSFEPIYVGPAEAGQVAISRATLAGSTNARIRITVDDGFNQKVVTSKPFTVAPSAPVVRIGEPLTGDEFAADAPIPLRGAAFGVGGAPLRAKSLVWSEGQRRLGRGESILATGLKPGRHKLTLSAAAGGQTGRASVVVKVTKVQPAFLALEAPPSIAANAKSVKLRVATTVASTLTIGRKRFQVGPKPKRITVPVSVKQNPVQLLLKLKSAGLTTEQAITIPRDG